MVFIIIFIIIFIITVIIQSKTPFGDILWQWCCNNDEKIKIKKSFSLSLYYWRIEIGLVVPLIVELVIFYLDFVLVFVTANFLLVYQFFFLFFLYFTFIFFYFLFISFAKQISFEILFLLIFVFMNLIWYWVEFLCLIYILFVSFMSLTVSCVYVGIVFFKLDEFDCWLWKKNF